MALSTVAELIGGTEGGALLLQPSTPVSDVNRIVAGMSPESCRSLLADIICEVKSGLMREAKARSTSPQSVSVQSGVTSPGGDGNNSSIASNGKGHIDSLFSLAKPTKASHLMNGDNSLSSRDVGKESPSKEDSDSGVAMTVLTPENTFLAGEDDDFDRINDYMLLEKLHVGPNSVVYLALKEADSDSNDMFSSDGGGEFAIKKLRRMVMGDNVLREIEIMKRLRHEHIVPLLEVIDDPTAKDIFLVMPFVTGGHLLDVDKPHTFPVPEQSLRWMHQLCRALSYLHDRDVTHGDIKPENVLVDRKKDRVKMLDFGMSDVINTCGVSSGMIGTPLFMSPEELKGAVDVAMKPTDIWALGCTFYMMLTGGTHPFECPRAEMPKGGFREVIESRLPVKIPSNPTSDMDPRINDVIRAMLNADPKMRPTARELRNHEVFATNAENGGLGMSISVSLHSPRDQSPQSSVSPHRFFLSSGSFEGGLAPSPPKGSISPSRGRPQPPSPMHARQ